jgi:hypothetical protein
MPGAPRSVTFLFVLVRRRSAPLATTRCVPGLDGVVVHDPA